MSIVYQPPTGHYCGPNQYGYWVEHWDDRPGTVRECAECGKSYVAWRDERNPGYMGVMWRREGWLARRRRERRESR